ncbi:hypothetical protein HY384_02475 [Candidatus Daviesbacteria bacterium]|nr:hypothetical protein [Candidatus Daviesbacteria bacterium]
MKRIYLLLQTLQEKFSSFSPRQRISLLVTIFILLAIPITLTALKYQHNIRSRAEEASGRIRVYDPAIQSDVGPLSDTLDGKIGTVNSPLVELQINFPNWNTAQVPSESSFATKIIPQAHAYYDDPSHCADADGKRYNSNNKLILECVEISYDSSNTSCGNPATDRYPYYFSECTQKTFQSPSLDSGGTGYCCGDNSRAAFGGGSCNGSFDDSLNPSTGYKNYYCPACAGKKDTVTGKSYEVCYTCQEGEAGCVSGGSSGGGTTGPTLNPAVAGQPGCAGVNAKGEGEQRNAEGKVIKTCTGFSSGTMQEVKDENGVKQYEYDSRCSGTTQGYNNYFWNSCVPLQTAASIDDCCTSNAQCGNGESCDFNQPNNAKCGYNKGTCQRGSGSGGNQPGGELGGGQWQARAEKSTQPTVPVSI